MELLLRVEPRADGATPRAVAVTLEPSHTVAALADALAAFCGLTERGLSLVRAATGERLPADATVAGAGLLSGEALVLGGEGRTVAQAATEPRGVRLAVVGGRSAGYARVLSPGTYTLGRNERDDPGHVTVADDTVGTDQLTLRISNDLSVFVTEKPDAVNKATVNGRTVRGPFSVGPDDIVRMGAASIALKPVGPTVRRQQDMLGQVPFHRTPRRPRQPVERTFAALGDVPTTPERSRFSYLTALLPLGGGIVLALAMREPRLLVFTLLAPLAAIANYVEHKRERGRKHDAAVERFRGRLAARADEIRAALDDERSRRLDSAPDVADLRLRAEQRSKDLWHRGRDLVEFLDLRIGVGTVTPLLRIEPERGGDDALRDEVDAVNAKAVALYDVPVGLPFAELGVVGVHGESSVVAGLAGALLVQAVCLHSPEDLVVAAAVGDESRISDWLKWTPHTRSTGSPIAGPHVVRDKAGADLLLRAVLDVAEFRAGSGGHGVDRRWPWILLTLDRALEPDAALVAQVLDHSPAAGISVLWVSDSPDRIPPQARAVVACAPARTGELSRVWFTDPDQAERTFDAEGVGADVPDAVARALAPLRDASASSTTTAIPRVVPLFTALGVDDVTTAWIEQEWAKDRGYVLESTVGLAASSPLRLDLVDHGPHGLIGGTSGSGKSELLQSLVAGLVASHSPDELTLLFIDFKGGSASEVFKDLPHVVGRVTDLDEALALRAQTSIRAELRHRVSGFAGKAKDLREMREKFPDEAPPSLVIVVDEFATLVKELPDFVAGLVDIAQRGRSYGVHLILATQRPSAAVDENILANTNLRISLRMLDSAESVSVISSPEAAEIPVPLKGRALARMGPGQLVEFQSAYSGAPLVLGGGPPPIEVASFDGLPGAAPARATVATSGRTQLDRLIEAVEGTQRPRAAQIWNDLLPSFQPLSDVRAERGRRGDALVPGRTIAIGKLDDPAGRSQHPAVVDLESTGGLLVFGSGGSGKTTLLRTVAVSAALDDSALGGGHLAVFAIDFASGELRGLASLPQCAEVATSADLEATTRILALLDAEIERRKGVAAHGAGDAAERHERVLLLVDGYASLVEALVASPGGQEQSTDQWLAVFHRIVLEGRQVGVHAVMAADRAASVRNSVLAAVTSRLVLRQADDNEARELGAPSTRSLRPGGGYLAGLRIQVATIAAKEGESDAMALSAMAPTINGSVPARLTTRKLPSDLGLVTRTATGLRGVLGIADLTDAAVEFDLTYSHLFVYGAPRSGRSTALLTIGHQLVAAGVDVFATGPDDSLLTHLTGATTGWGVDGAVDVLGKLDGSLAHPKAVSPRVLLFDDVDLMDDSRLYPFFDPLLAHRAVRIVASVAGVTNLFMNKLVQELPKKSRQILFLQPGSAREVSDLVGVRLPLLRLGLEMPRGRGMFVANRVPVVAQVCDPLYDAGEAGDGLR
ncbi:MAG TPA: FtsK/SpoIIIE domain-containing protein [Frankiaceae bacterium]|nr:FtsK/SpoIIIE domain-containing protein [Frankiaceae bacterium]